MRRDLQMIPLAFSADCQSVRFSSFYIYKIPWARIFKCLWGSGIDSKEWIPPSLCSLAGWYDKPIPLRFLAPLEFSKIPALVQTYFRKFMAPLETVSKFFHCVFAYNSMKRKKRPQLALLAIAFKIVRDGSMSLTGPPRLADRAELKKKYPRLSLLLKNYWMTPVLARSSSMDDL